MTPGMQVLIACLAILAVCSLIGVVWLAAAYGELRNRVDLIDDRTTPSFAGEHDPAPKTQPDIRQASKVAPPDILTKEFAGPDGTVHTFQFGGDG